MLRLLLQNIHSPPMRLYGGVVLCPKFLAQRQFRCRKTIRWAYRPRVFTPLPPSPRIQAVHISSRAVMYPHP